MRLTNRLDWLQNEVELSTPSIAQMLSNTLYGRRFFPYYTFNIVAGIDDDGVGCVYGYDAVGSFERAKYVSEGSGVALVQPLLDNQVNHFARCGLSHRH